MRCSTCNGALKPPQPLGRMAWAQCRDCGSWEGRWLEDGEELEEMVWDCECNDTPGTCNWCREGCPEPDEED